MLSNSGLLLHLSLTKSLICFTSRVAVFLAATQKTNESMSSLARSNEIDNWSVEGLIIWDIKATKSCLLMNLSSTSIPSQQLRPLHHRVNVLSDSFSSDEFSISCLPSSPSGKTHFSYQSTGNYHFKNILTWEKGPTMPKIYLHIKKNMGTRIK